MLGLALIAGSLLSGCAAYREVTELTEIQDAPGFYPKALYYCGSTGTCHYFEQETPLADLTWLSRHDRLIKVNRREVTLPEGLEFALFPFEERSDPPPREKMRIRITQLNPNRGVAEYVPQYVQQ
jgi:hypothetical protein